MGLYNLVTGRMTCPRCQRVCEVEVETRLGDVSQVASLQLGDRYPWPPNHRPLDGTACGEGYCECPLCGKDFFVRVQVEADVLSRLEVDPDQPGFIPD